jgi:hypothetical protein
MNRSQKENQSEQTYFRLSIERGSHPGGPNTGYFGPSGRQQDSVACFDPREGREGEEDHQEASQENDCGEQHQRKTRSQVIDDGDRP